MRISGPGESGHRVYGLPGEPAEVNLAYALLRLRSAGASGLRLVLPRAGDPGGLPGPAEFTVEAVARGAAVLTTGDLHLGLLADGRAAWVAHPVTPDLRTPMTVPEAQRQLDTAIREAADELARLDVARWDPAAAEVLAGRSAARSTPLPDSWPAAAHRLLDQATRIAVVVELAGRSEGAAVSAGEMRARTRALSDLDSAARRATEVACSAPVA